MRNVVKTSVIKENGGNNTSSCQVTTKKVLDHNFTCLLPETQFLHYHNVSYFLFQKQ